VEFELEAVERQTTLATYHPWKLDNLIKLTILKNAN